MAPHTTVSYNISFHLSSLHYSYLAPSITVCDNIEYFLALITNIHIWHQQQLLITLFLGTSLHYSYSAPILTVHRQTSERQTSERTNVRTTNVRKDKRQKRQTSERTNVRSDKRQKRQTSEGTNVRKTNVGKTSEKNVRKTLENHNIIYTINILIF